MSNRAIAGKVSAYYGRDWVAHYVYWKIRLDPVYEAVRDRLSETSRPILDVGCGVGVLPFYLHTTGIEVPYTGLDLDRSKIERAREVASGLRGDFAFEAKLVEEVGEIPGHVLLLDVVHYLEDAQQLSLLQSISERVGPGSRVVLRETISDGSWRAKVTWLEEAFARATGWMRTSTINFPTLDEIDGCFPPERFDRTVEPLWGRTPFNSYLLEYICR